jgi:hypothetical protein
MRTLRLVSERSSNELGRIELTDGVVAFSNDNARDVFTQFQRVANWSDQETFDALATGWSNGYITIPRA